MRPLRILLVLVLIAIPAVAVGSLAWAGKRSEEKLADGARIGGVDVGGLTRDEALARLRGQISTPARRAARITVGGRTFTLTARQAGMHLSLGPAVTAAQDASRQGNLLQRGWRELTGGRVEQAVPVKIAVDRAAVRSFVGSIHAAVARRPKDATLAINVTSVTVTPSATGRRLAGREDLVGRVTRALAQPQSARQFRATIATVAPKVSEDGLFDAQPTAVTVSRRSKTVRVFERGKLTKTYRVAVGEPRYPTPVGRYVVQTMQKNPTWNVPHSAWAGDMAGQVIPGGDPRNPLVARWIGFNGSVGFHGTKSAGSLGQAASHGCVRMAPSDVIDLFQRVRTGTPVLVAS